MGNDSTSKIIQTVMQVAVAILCIFPVQGWAIVHSSSTTYPYWHMNMLDVAYDISHGSYMMAEIVIIAAVCAVVLNWTKLRTIMFIPIIVECAIVFRCMAYIMHSHGEDSMVTMLPCGWLHVVLVTASLALAIYVAFCSIKKRNQA